MKERKPEEETAGKLEDLLTMFTVCVLLVNAIAILSEDRFLARGAFFPFLYPLPLLLEDSNKNTADVKFDI